MFREEMEQMNIEIRRRHIGGYFVNFWDSLHGNDLTFVVYPEGKIMQDVYDEDKDEIVEIPVDSERAIDILNMFWEAGKRQWDSE